VPLSYQLKSGDQVEILSSNKQKPKEEWLGFVVTAKAKSKIKHALRNEKIKIAEEGKEILNKRLELLKVPNNKVNQARLVKFFNLANYLDLCYQVATGVLSSKMLKDAIGTDRQVKEQSGLSKKTGQKTLEEIVQEIRGKTASLVVGQGVDRLDYKIASCCNPIPGDDVCGFITLDEGIIIHRTNCPAAIQLMSNFGTRIVKTKWMNRESLSFLAGIRVTGIDEVGIVNNITRIISNELNVNMRSLSFDTNDGVFEGTIQVFVNDTHHLTDLIGKLKKVSGVLKVFRMDSN
jgi:GTP pyrophosphokinase